MTTPTRTRLGPEEGAVAAEFALTISILLLLVLGVIQFALAIWQGHTMLVAVSHAGRYVMIQSQSQPPPSCSSLKTEAQTRMHIVAPDATVSASETASDCSGGIKLTASYNTALVSLISSMSVSPSLCVPMEQACTP